MTRAFRHITCLLACWSIGCTVFPALLSDSAERIAATPCQGSACDRGAWAVLHVGQYYAGVIWPASLATSNSFLTFDFVPPPDVLRFGEGLVTASARPQDLRLALIDHTKTLYLADYGASSADRSTAVGAVGVGWSNSGDRLAVVTASDDGSAMHVLRVFDDELAELETFEIEMPAVPEGVLYWRLIVSWSANDELIAVSTDRDRAYPGFPARAVVVQLADGTVAAGDFGNAFFVGVELLVALPADAVPGIYEPGEASVLRWRDGGLAQESVVSGPQSIVASDAKRGVFVTIEPSFRNTMPTQPVGLRTIDSGPDLVSGTGFTDTGSGAILLAPRGIAEANL